MQDVRLLEVISQINSNGFGNEWWGVITSSVDTWHFFGTAESETLCNCIYLYHDTREDRPLTVDPDASYIVDDFTEVLIYNASNI